MKTEMIKIKVEDYTWQDEPTYMRVKASRSLESIAALRRRVRRWVDSKWCNVEDAEQALIDAEPEWPVNVDLSVEGDIQFYRSIRAPQPTHHSPPGDRIYGRTMIVEGDEEPVLTEGKTAELGERFIQAKRQHYMWHRAFRYIEVVLYVRMRELLPPMVPGQEDMKVLVHVGPDAFAWSWMKTNDFSPDRWHLDLAMWLDEFRPIYASP